MPQLMRSRRPPRADVSAAILDAAVGLFAQRGYEATTMQDVAGRVGMTAPALYYYFDSKQAMLHEVISLNLSRILGRLEAAVASADSSVERLRAFVETHVGFQLEKVDRARVYNAMFLGAESILSALAPRQRIAILAQQEGVTGLLKSVLAQGHADRSFMMDDVTVTARGILALGEFAPAWFKPSGRLSADEVAAACGRLAIRMVGGRLTTRSRTRGIG